MTMATIHHFPTIAPQNGEVNHHDSHALNRVLFLLLAFNHSGHHHSCRHSITQRQRQPPPPNKEGFYSLFILFIGFEKQ